MLKTYEKVKKWWRNTIPQEICISPKFKKIFWGVLFVISISLILTIDSLPDPIDLEEGQVSRMDIKAPRSITFVDEEKTSELREQAAQSVGRVYEEDVNIINNVNRDISNFFTEIRETRRKLFLLESSIENIEADESIDEQTAEEESRFTAEQEILAEIIQKYTEISDETIATLITSSDEALQLLEIEANKLTTDIYQQRFTPEDLPKIRERITQELMALDISREHRLALANIMEVFIRPNMIFDEAATNEKREEARKKVTPVTHTVRQDEMIVRSGDVVTEDDIKVLEALGLLKPQVNYLSIAGVIIIVLDLVIISSIYLYK